MKKISILFALVFALFTGFSQNATIVLEAHDVWADGTGYQILLAPTSAGVTLPTGQITCGDNTLYNACAYKIPTNADASDANVIVDGTGTLQIPAGHYSYIILNPGCTGYSTIYIAAAGVDPTSVADYNFEANTTYHFTMARNGNNDGTTLTISVDAPDQLALESLNLPSEAGINTDVDVSGTITNRGNNNITSYDVTYNISGGNNVATYTVTGINIAPYATHTFTHNIPINVTTSQIATVNVTVSNANGGAQANTSTLSQVINFFDASLSVPRKVLLEHFTTESCGNCPAATANLVTWLSSRPNIIWLAHHAGYYTDSFTIPASEQLTTFFNDGGNTYAPAIMLDRYFLSPDGDTGPVFFPSSTYTPTLMDQRLATPAFVTVGITGSYAPATRELSVTVSGQVKDVLPGNDIRLSVYITETDVDHVNQTSAPAGYVHHYIARAALAGTYGDANVVTNTTGSQYTKNYTYTLPATWDASKCQVVAFVNEWNPSNVNNSPVFNAESVSVESISGVNEYANAVSCNVYPNPASDVLNIQVSEDMTRIELVSAIGQKVMSQQVNGLQTTINVNDYVNGIYFLTIYTQNGKISKKITINK
ncbi:MAG: DUF2436 domain-containing protein [Bacteroidales bacterium]|nr:DUF2436 domain-containing protein [Bacteroidales bacterium]